MAARKQTEQLLRAHFTFLSKGLIKRPQWLAENRMNRADLKCIRAQPQQKSLFCYGKWTVKQTQVDTQFIRDSNAKMAFVDKELTPCSAAHLSNSLSALFFSFYWYWSLKIGVCKTQGWEFKGKQEQLWASQKDRCRTPITELRKFCSLYSSWRFRLRTLKSSEQSRRQEVVFHFL